MVLALGIFGIAHNVHAISGWQNTYTTYFGVSASCSLCHTSAPALNATGTTFLNNGANTIAGWTSIKPADTTPPTVTITNPANTPYSASSTPLSIAGTASDNFTSVFGVTQVSWSNSLGGSGTATGTTSWSGSIPLVSGSNVIAVTARDAAGNTATGNPHGELHTATGCGCARDRFFHGHPRFDHLRSVFNPGLDLVRRSADHVEH